MVEYDQGMGDYGCWNTGSPKQDAGAEEKKTEEEKSNKKNGKIWTQFYKPDPRIALGKYSPLEKEILHLGGTHTISARRFLARKQEEERKMLKELKLLSSDYKQAKTYKTQSFFPCSICGPSEKIWTAKVVVPPGELTMPPRERTNIDKHIERMRFARVLGSGQFSHYPERFGDSTYSSRARLDPLAKDKARGTDENRGANPTEAAEQQEKKKTGDKPTGRQEIKLKVTFKSEEPKKCVPCNVNERRSLLPTRKPERCITGLTNRCLFHSSDFPGDLMLMNQDFISRGTRPNDVMKACLPRNKGKTVSRDY
ncbi:uncharacterized protein C10orf120 homolog [Echinops telfairi]|uniref:Uncharacterized protein C10orf120 homolog n=1 Tax=Echinops telfairi TaxID=9371 RepID=A0AC55D6F1_ECHTE|nr:uncharacterized protein C10orf120 homolog [Echinops telfairi]